MNCIKLTPAYDGIEASVMMSMKRLSREHIRTEL
jgi:hypothetical protein